MLRNIVTLESQLVVTHRLTVIGMTPSYRRDASFYSSFTVTIWPYLVSRRTYSEMMVERHFFIVYLHCTPPLI